MNQEFDRMLGEGDFLIFYFSPPSRRNVKGSSPLYFPVIDQPSALPKTAIASPSDVENWQMTTLNAVSDHGLSNEPGLVPSAQIAQKLVLGASPKSPSLSRETGVKKV